MSRVRRARPDDLGALTRVEAASFPSPWSRDVLAGELAADDRLVLVAESAGEVAGFAIFHRLPAECELLRLAVDPMRRRRGLASTLVAAGLERLRRGGAELCHLEVRADDAGARAFYVACGFERVGARPRYYADGTDAALYRRHLDRAPPAPAAMLD